jgi:hypothetical protein
MQSEQTQSQKKAYLGLVEALFRAGEIHHPEYYTTADRI